MPLGCSRCRRFNHSISVSFSGCRIIQTRCLKGLHFSEPYPTVPNSTEQPT